MPVRTDFILYKHKGELITMNKCIKVSIAAVSAAFATVVEAKSSGDDYTSAAQVYDLTITVKTTVAQRGKLKKGHPFDSSTDAVTYRKQGTQKWSGLIWGCDCEALAGKWVVVDDEAGTVAGCVIWSNAKPNNVLFIDDINWRLLNAIDKKGDKCEGSWTIGDMSSDSDAFLSFAGFGTLQIVYTAQPCEDPELNCTSYLKSMSGNVAGWMPAPSYTTGGKEGSCTFCGEYVPGEEPTEDMATAWDFCPCEEYADIEFTAVSGTWSIKYNASSSRKLKEKASIVDAVKMPANVKSRVLDKIHDTRAGN